jgi:hypothetical protein
MKNLDWTIQEADHFKAERREPGEIDSAVLEREPVGQASPEDPVDVPPRTDVSSNLPAIRRTCRY